LCFPTDKSTDLTEIEKGFGKNILVHLLNYMVKKKLNALLDPKSGDLDYKELLSTVDRDQGMNLNEIQ